MNGKLVMKACGVAKRAHKGQKYGDKDYYWHVYKVAHTYEDMFGYDDIGICVSYLHDTIEDTCETYESLQYVFGDDIADAVVLLTRVKGESYEGYLKLITEDLIASRVKYCDSLVNLEKCIETHQWKRAQKYLDNLKYLKEFV